MSRLSSDDKSSNEGGQRLEPLSEIDRAMLFDFPHVPRGSAVTGGGLGMSPLSQEFSLKDMEFFGRVFADARRESDHSAGGPIMAHIQKSIASVRARSVSRERLTETHRSALFDLPLVSGGPTPTQLDPWHPNLTEEDKAFLELVAKDALREIESWRALQGKPNRVQGSSSQM